MVGFIGREARASVLSPNGLVQVQVFNFIKTKKMTDERKELVEKFQLWLDTNPRNKIIASQCATIAEEYAERKIKNLNLHLVNNSETSVCKHCGSDNIEPVAYTMCKDCHKGDLQTDC